MTRWGCEGGRLYVPNKYNPTIPNGTLHVFFHLVRAPEREDIGGLIFNPEVLENEVSGGGAAAGAGAASKLDRTRRRHCTVSGRAMSRRAQ